MKKIVYFLSLFILTGLCSSSQKRSAFEEFLYSNKIPYQDVEPYLEYPSFRLDDFFAIEVFRENLHLTPLQALNQFHTKTPSPAPFQNSTLVLVNKNYYLDKTFAPDNLIAVKDLPIRYANDDISIPDYILDKYLQMIEELELSNLYLFSAFRTYEKQKILYDYYKDDNYSARPGYSEHQTGLALDVSLLGVGLLDAFEDTHEFNTLKQNAHRYGFILRYPKGKESITGYYYEPWHFRYVGSIHATYIYNNRLTLEEYLYANFDLASSIP